MRKETSLLLLIAYLFFTSILSAQNKPFVRFDEDNGLAGNKVCSILKDSEGYLWIGTDNGLSKYNGEKFINFKKGNGLPGNRIWALATDGKRQLFVGCYKDGLAVIEDDKIVKVFHLNSKFPNSIRRMHYSVNSQMLIVGTDYGIYLFKDSTFHEVIYFKDSVLKSSVLNIVEHNNCIYFTSHTPYGKGGLYRININVKSPSKSLVKSIDNQTGNKFSLTELNNILYSNCYSDIFSYPIGDLSMKRIVATANSQFLPWVSCPINNHEILLGGFGEGSYVSDLQVFNTITRKFSKLPYKTNTQSINELMYDPDTEIFWVCSDNGLLSLFRSPFEINELLGVDGVIDIATKEDVIYILEKEGVYILQNGEMIKKYDINEITDIIVELRDKLYYRERDDSISIFNKLPLTLSCFSHDNNKLYVVTSKGCISIPDFNNYLPFNSKNFITDTKGGAYFVGEYEKLRYYSSINESIQNRFIMGNQGGVFDIFQIIKIGEVVYFASFYNGLYAIKDTRVYYLNEANSEIDNSLTGMTKDNKGGIWCTSAYGNLFNIGFDGKLFIKRKLSELNSGIIGENYKWLEFNERNLFVGTNKGLNIIPITQLQKSEIDSIQFYNGTNGYDFISANSPIKDTQGNIYIYTSNKIIKISNIRNTGHKSTLVFQHIMLNNQPIRLDIINGKTLPYSTVGINFEFQLIKYPNSKNSKYRYRVNKGKWEEGGKVSLQSLKSGNYSIEAEAQDLESHDFYLREIQFRIALPFWQQWWFVITAISFISLIVFSSIKWRIIKIKKKEADKNSLIRRNAELKIQSLQVQMNPHFIFNSLNSIQSFILSSNIKDAVMYLGYLGSIIRMNLEMISEEHIHLSNEVIFLTKYIETEKMRFKEKLDIRMNNNTKDLSLLIPPMLVQPIIENAIKHGVRHMKHTGLIQISFDIVNSLLLVTIQDNGVGRIHAGLFADKNHKSFGLKLINQRIALLNEKNKTQDYRMDIMDMVEDGCPVGTIVRISLPIVNAT